SSTVQRSASHGSSSCVTLLVRTRRACVSAVTSSVLVSRAARRLNDLGSVGTEPPAAPPRPGRIREAAGSPPARSRLPQPATTSTAAMNPATTTRWRSEALETCPTGQEVGRSSSRAIRPVDVIFCAKRGTRRKRIAETRRPASLLANSLCRSPPDTMLMLAQQLELQQRVRTCQRRSAQSWYPTCLY